MAMIFLQYVQSLLNFGASILGTIGFTTFIIFLYNTRFACDEFFNCNLYNTIQANAAFSFVIIFLPWIGCFLAFMGKKSLAIIYAILIIGITASLLICSAIILANQDIKDIWKLVRNNDQYKLYAFDVNAMIIYQVSIAQIICIWFFLMGSAVLTPLAAKQEEQKTK